MKLNDKFYTKKRRYQIYSYLLCFFDKLMQTKCYDPYTRKYFIRYLGICEGIAASISDLTDIPYTEVRRSMISNDSINKYFPELISFKPYGVDPKHTWWVPNKKNMKIRKEVVTTCLETIRESQHE